MSAPIQCSDDVDPSTLTTTSTPNPSYQTGREVSGSNMQMPAAPPATDLATDAQLTGRLPPVAAAPMAKGAVEGGRAPDTVIIPGKHGMIYATGLSQNLRPGANLQIGDTNHMTVHHHKDGSTSTTTVGSKVVPNRFPITVSQAFPDEQHLRAVSREITGEWRQLGRRLRLSDAALDQIHMDYNVLGQQEVNHQVLRKWTETSYPATLQLLATALAKVGRGDLADMLSQMS